MKNDIPFSVEGNPTTLEWHFIKTDSELQLWFQGDMVSDYYRVGYLKRQLTGLSLEMLNLGKKSIKSLVSHVIIMSYQILNLRLSKGASFSALSCGIVTKVPRQCIKG